MQPNGNDSANTTDVDKSLADDLQRNMAVFLERKITEFLDLYVEAAILFVGIVGNVLVLRVYSGESYSNRPMFVYLRALAAVDLLALSVVLCTHWMSNFVTIHADAEDPSSVDVLVCKSIIMLAQELFDYSAWLVVAMACTHVIALTRPHQFARVCTVTIAGVVVGVTGASTMLKNAYVFRLGAIIAPANSTKSMCVLLYEKQRPADTAFAWLDLVSCRIVPLCLLVYCSFRILLGLCTMTTGQVVHAAKKRQIAIMLLFVSVCFVLLTLPNKVLTAALSNRERPAFESHQAAVDLLAITISLKLNLLNYAVNVWIYCIVSTEFRNDLRNVLRCGTCKVSPVTSSNTSWVRTLKGRRLTPRQRKR